MAENNNIFVSAIELGVNNATLANIFGQFGTVTWSKILPSNGMPNQAAIIEYANASEAQWVVENVNGNIPQGLTEPVHVQFKKQSGGKGGPGGGKGADRAGPGVDRGAAQTTQLGQVDKAFVKFMEKESVDTSSGVIDSKFAASKTFAGWALPAQKREPEEKERLAMEAEAAREGYVEKKPEKRLAMAAQVGQMPKDPKGDYGSSSQGGMDMAGGCGCAGTPAMMQMMQMMPNMAMMANMMGMMGAMNPCMMGAMNPCMMGMMDPSMMGMMGMAAAAAASTGGSDEQGAGGSGAGGGAIRSQTTSERSSPY